MATSTAPVGMHIANGMYGLILVEPEGGLPRVDRFNGAVGSLVGDNALAATVGETIRLFVGNGGGAGLCGELPCLPPGCR